jgi:hypothetical protein
MYEVKQAQVARAIDVLRAGPVTAAQFAGKMWPDRRNDDGGERSQSQQSHAGHAFLRRLGVLGYVNRTGDLWTIRQFSGGGSANHSVNGAPNSPANGALDLSANGLLIHPLSRSPNDPPPAQAEHQRLVQLVQQATEPLASVTHDAAFGDLAIRGASLDAALLEACASVVLLGRSANVYPPCAGQQMFVALSPAESARALFLTWTRSGNPPALPRPGAWITIDDGIVATPGFWRPQGAPAGWIDPEDVRTRIARQRGAAGLA